MKTNSPAALPYAHKGNLTSGPVRDHLVRMTVPMIWGIMTILSFQLVNTFYVSLLGTDALAAITFTFPVTYGIFSLIMGMGIATSSVISRQIGTGNAARVRRLTLHALILAVIMGLLFAGLGLLAMDPLFRAMGVPDELMPLVRDYMLIWFAGSVFVNAPLVGNAALRAAGDSMSPALIMTVAALVNVVLDPILIFGLFGFPRLEMQGAAISTVFANGCALIACVYVIAVRKKMLTRSRRHMRLFGDSVKRFLFIAIPAGLTSAIQPLTNAVMTALLAASGPMAVAGFGIATRVEAFAFIIIMALATGMAPVIGQNWGARQFGRVNEALRQALLFAGLWSLGVSLVFAILARPIAQAFSSEPEVIRTACLYFWIVAPTYFLANLVPGWASAFNAMGLPQRSFMMIAVKLIVLNIPLAVLGAHLYGVTGVFAAIAITNVVCGLAFHVFNRRYCRRHDTVL